MALNKAQTSTGTKVVLILLIIAFVVSFVSIGTGLFSSPTTGGTGTATTASTINAQYQSTVSALNASLQSDPESSTVLTSLGNTYFDWALKLQQAAQTDTTLVGADQPMWVAAKDAYSRAVAAGATEPGVRVDWAITRYYTADTAGAIETAEAVAAETPDFGPAWLNLGIFYRAAGRTEDAVAAFEKAVELDPNSDNGAFAKSQLEELKSAPATSTP